MFAKIFKPYLPGQPGSVVKFYYNVLKNQMPSPQVAFLIRE